VRTTSATALQEGHDGFRAILWGGLIAGFLDITYACVFSYLRRGTNPKTILQSVASGALGASAFKGGWGTAILGAVFHFLIAFVAATIYFLASRKLKFLVQWAVVCGLLYGVLIYLFMNLVVLPLSAISFKPSYPLLVLATGLAVHMFFIGLPISLAVRHYSK